MYVCYLCVAGVAYLIVWKVLGLEASNLKPQPAVKHWPGKNRFWKKKFW